MKRWYVVQVYAGYEEVAKKDILRQAQLSEFGESVGEVLVPSAKQKQSFGLSQPEDQQLFPGYVLVQMEAIPEAMRLVESSPRVLKLLGDPLSHAEEARMLSQVKGEIAVGTEQQSFSVGGEVEIASGPFAGFNGVIDRVDVENEKLTVMVSIFGRMTPVELGFHQVKR